MKKKYIYYMAFYFIDKMNSTGCGSAKITIDFKIKTFDDLMEVKHRFEHENNYQNIIILNYTKMKK